MSVSSSVRTLCCYSRSERHSYAILQSCPLDIPRSKCEECPCRKMIRNLDEFTFKVTSCQYPATWWGGEMRSLEQARQYFKKGEPMPDAKESDQSLWCGMKIPVITVTGERNSGKTLFASTIRPTKTLMIDCEKSSETYESGKREYSLQFKRRVDIFQELLKQGKPATPLAAWLVVKELIESADPKEFQVVVIDTWDFIQEGLVEWIRTNPAMHNRTANEYEKASSMTLWPDVKSWLQMWLGIQADRLDGTIVLNNHLVDVWADGKKTSKQKSKGLDVIFKVASISLRLIRDPGQAMPRGITANEVGGKCRLVRMRKDKNGEPVWTADKDGRPMSCADPILPPVIENCSPQMIRWYIENPPNYAKLKKSEVFTAPEMSDEEKLAIKAKMAEDIRVTEETRMSRLEMMREAGQRQAAAKVVPKPTASPVPAATAAPTKPAATTPATAPAVPAAVAPAASIPFEVDAPAKSEEPWQTAERQRTLLKIDDIKWEAKMREKGSTDGTSKTVAPAVLQDMISKLHKMLIERGLLEEMGKA